MNVIKNQNVRSIFAFVGCKKLVKRNVRTKILCEGYPSTRLDDRRNMAGFYKQDIQPSLFDEAHWACRHSSD
ncbi:hypothetical protein ACVWWO_000033 [Bradyrhizobium sp. F1.13.1]